VLSQVLTPNYHVVPGIPDEETAVMEPSVAMAKLLAQFQESFPDEASCAAYLFKRRWPGGFVCPGCHRNRAVSLKSRAFTRECLDCGRQTSITAGTVMHRSKLPLTVWFWAAHLVAAHSDSMSYESSARCCASGIRPPGY
jgi:Transposase zinc-ribbon domain